MSRHILYEGLYILSIIIVTNHEYINKYILTLLTAMVYRNSKYL